MYLHSVELNEVAVTEDVTTLRLVWAHLSRYGDNWLYQSKVYKALTVVMYSSQLSNFQLSLFTSYFIYLLIDCLLLTPRGCMTELVGV